jgi:hypothetical protein
MRDHKPDTSDASDTPVPAWLRSLVTWMDEAFVVPGTRFRIGMDAIIGFLVPGAGDTLTAGSQVALLWSAFRARVPRVVLARMVLNAGIDALLGVVPFAGDAFDAFFKANRRNLQLLERHRGRGPLKATAGDYVVVFAALGAVGALLLLPFVLLTLVLGAVFR